MTDQWEEKAKRVIRKHLALIHGLVSAVAAAMPESAQRANNIEGIIAKGSMSTVCAKCHLPWDSNNHDDCWNQSIMADESTQRARCDNWLGTTRCEKAKGHSGTHVAGPNVDNPINDNDYCEQWESIK